MRVTFGITGSIAAYKAVYIIRELVKRGEDVYCILTSEAKHFVTPLTLSTLTGRKVYEDPFISAEETIHITLAKNDVILVAPATYNIIGKISAGISDDLITSTVAATKKPVIIAPSMNPNMWSNPLLQRNLVVLKEMGYYIIEPESGKTACGDIGIGRLPEPDKILDYVYKLFDKLWSLRGLRVLVTTGRTEEDIDPVRVITNRSSGRMGYEIAEEARKRGAKVTLIKGATDITITDGVRVHNSREMKDKLLELIDENDILVMAAAVSDFKPVKKRSTKLKRRNGKLTLELQSTEDLLKMVRLKGGDKLIVGFSVGDKNLIEESKIKLKEKSLDMMVANHHSVIGSLNTTFSIVEKGGGVRNYQEMNKREAAAVILDCVEKLWKKRSILSW